MESIVYRREGGSLRFFLEGTRLQASDAVEVRTPLGWLRGEFWWSLPSDGWPLMVVPGQGAAEPVLVLLLPGVECRRGR